MGHTSTQIYAPVFVSDVQAVLVTQKTGVFGLCTLATINRYARCKPYNFGGLLADGITEEIRKSGNYGMTPVPVSLVRQGSSVAGSSPGWGQWSVPDGADPDHPGRLGDFNGYSHTAGPWLSAARIYTNNPDNDKIPMGGKPGNIYVQGKIYGDVTISGAEPGYTLPIGLFHHPLGDLHTLTGTTDFSQWCLTLIWGAYEGAEWVAGAWWWEQSEPVGSLGAGEYRLSLSVSHERQQAVEAAEGLCNVGILCLAPPARDGVLDMGDARVLVSLNMWNDSTMEADTVFASKTIAPWTPPAVSMTYDVYGDFIGALTIMESSVSASALNYVFAPLFAEIESDSDIVYTRLSNASFYIGMEFSRSGFRTRGIVPVRPDMAVRLSAGDRKIWIFDDDTPVSLPVSEIRRYMNNGLPSGTYALRMEPILVSGGVVYDVEDPFAVRLNGLNETAYDSWAEEGIDVGIGVYGEWITAGTVNI